MTLRPAAYVALLLPQLAFAQTTPQPGPPPPQIVATATGEARLRPDRANILVGVQVGPVIDAALGKGANQIDAVQLFSSNTDVARRQALADAIGKARGDADAMARAAGGKLGPLLEITTTDDGGGPRPMYRSAGGFRGHPHRGGRPDGGRPR